MPFFAYVPTDHDKVKLIPGKAHHAVVAHKRPQNVRKKVPATEARTLLPMNGGSTTVVSTQAVTPAIVQSPTPGSQTPATPPTILLPDDAVPGAGKTQGVQPRIASGSSKSNNKVHFIASLYFDAGAEDLIGTFTTLVLRAGLRYHDDELSVYFRNETLDTVGTNLPFQQVINGASFGAAYRHYFLKDHVFITVSDGYYVSGPFQNQWDFRAGAVGEWGWQSEKMFTDIYTDLFYVKLLDDTIYTGRVRSGPILFRNKSGYVIGYGVAQLIADSAGAEGTENRAEVGFGVGYIFLGHFALNVDLRGGYSYRGEITNRVYLNPMIVLSGSF